MRAWRLPRVTMLIQYLYRDEPQLDRFQSGLVFIDDRPKPSLQGFHLPFAEIMGAFRSEYPALFGRMSGETIQDEMFRPMRDA